MSIDLNSEFAKEIRKVFKDFSPTRLIETGTYLGLGSTAILAQTLKDLEIKKPKLFSIEINPRYYRQAVENIYILGFSNIVQIFNGLSIRRNQLPSLSEIQEEFVNKVWSVGTYIDHDIEDRVKRYYEETNFVDMPDMLLLQCLRMFDFFPDFVLLDSGGHIGYTEFTTLLKYLINPCIVSLDDIYHVKHHNSFLDIQKDKRFKILKVSSEKFGFCITYFTPRGRDETP
jgi:hypothetical protein